MDWELVYYLTSLSISIVFQYTGSDCADSAASIDFVKVIQGYW